MLVLSLPQEHAEMGATCHLETSSEIFTVLWNIMPPEGTNMYSISEGYTQLVFIGYFFIIFEPSEKSITVPQKCFLIMYFIKK